MLASTGVDLEVLVMDDRSEDRTAEIVRAVAVRDPRVRVALSFHPLFVGGNPFRTTSVYGMIAYLERKWGVHWVMGGTGALVRGLVSLIEGQGNEVRLNAEVAEILLEGRRAVGVKLASGEEIRADVVVSNAYSAWTYRHLLPPTARRRTWTRARLTLPRSRRKMRASVRSRTASSPN